ncbi:hypothetical protein F7725_012454 [Dissostichus mawsoni]|uniref:GAGE domain-containing protein n=1 Tax=Dissostichus mawsoni TaxID=36200 RepID=A0A7J5YMD0_DISMA|nr:hypothetical protein F7725_012454 [Dissostichus mawsoni]
MFQKKMGRSRSRTPPRRGGQVLPEREGVPAPLLGIVSEGEGRRSDPVLEIASAEEVAPDLLTGDDPGLPPDAIAPHPPERRDEDSKEPKEKAAKPILISEEDMEGKTERGD